MEAKIGRLLVIDGCGVVELWIEMELELDVRRMVSLYFSGVISGAQAQELVRTREASEFFQCMSFAQT